MGGNCTCYRQDHMRQQYTTHGNPQDEQDQVLYTDKVQRTLTDTLDFAKDKIKPHLSRIQSTCDEAIMLANDYNIFLEKDKSQTKVLTRFELRLPFSKIEFEEYEKRIKKLLSPDQGNIITLRQLEASFLNHPAFDELYFEGTLTRQIFKSKVLQCKDCNEDELNVQYLILMGILYCNLSAEAKAEKLFELCTKDLEELILSNSEELSEYLLKLQEISFDMIYQLYMSFKEKSEEELELDIDWAGRDALYRERRELILNSVIFVRNVKLTKKTFVYQITDYPINILTSWNLRNLINEVPS